ncbi:MULTISPECIES: chemotaxis protein CheW [unclassified Paenibacillus]|uniref:chemotaxis protein CheW n=1 Tax=unclassified Paenibacillus TaxID=185978 RepID=UPI0030FC755B
MLAARTEQYIIFRLVQEKLAIDIREINEIIKMEPITAVPNSKSFIKGVINLRGKIIPVVSLCRRFGLAESPPDTRSRIVVVHYRQEAIGIMVDSVEKVASFQQVEPPPEAHEVQGVQYMDGIGMCAEELISILNIGRLLSHG